MPEDYAAYTGTTKDRRSGIDRRAEDRPPPDRGFPVDGEHPRRWHHLACWVQLDPTKGPPTAEELHAALAEAGITAVDGFQLRPVPR